MWILKDIFLMVWLVIMSLLFIVNTIGVGFDIQQIRENIAVWGLTWFELLSVALAISFLVVVFKLIWKLSKYEKAKPKIIHLQNREALIKAIVDVKEKAIAVAWSADRYWFKKEHNGDTTSEIYERQAEWNSYEVARKNLEIQRLIAGQTYKGMLSGYLWYIQSNVDAYMGFPNAEKPISSILFKALLEDFVEWTINLLDDTVVSSQVPDKKDSQTE